MERMLVTMVTLACMMAINIRTVQVCFIYIILLSRKVETRIDAALTQCCLRRAAIPKDGFCIISAWRFALAHLGYENLSINSILKTLRGEVIQHKAFYENWVTGDL